MAKRAKVLLNTPEEEAAIQRGIADDPDAPELTDEQLAEMRPAREVMPPELYASLVRRRGPGKTPAKVSVSLRLPPDVADGLRGLGAGWQAKAAAALARLVDTGGRQD